MKLNRILVYAGQENTAFIPENEDGTLANPWVKRNNCNMFEVVSEIMKQFPNEAGPIKLVYLWEGREIPPEKV